MKTVLIFVLICTSVLSVVAQSENTVLNNLNITLGYQNRVLLDEQKSALVYKTGEYLASLGFSRDAPGSLMSFSIEATTGNMSPKYLGDRWIFTRSYDINGNEGIDSFPVQSGIISGKIQIAWMKKFESRERITYLAGAAVKDILIYPENYIGLMNSLGLHAKFASIVRISGKSNLYSDVSFPLIGINTRLPWHNTATDPMDPELTTFFKKGTRVVGPYKFRMLELNAHYNIKLARHWNLGAAYTFTWLNIPYYKPMKSYQNSFKLVTSYTF